MIWTTPNNLDLSWAIMLQMEGKLTRTDVLGIIETHMTEVNTDNIG